MTGKRSMYTTILAGRGVSRPKALFDGPHGFVHLLNQPIDFRTADRGLTAVEQTYLRQYCSLIHGQVIIDAVLAVRTENHLRGQDVARVSLEVFQGAYDFAGGERTATETIRGPRTRPTTT